MRITAIPALKDMKVVQFGTRIPDNHGDVSWKSQRQHAPYA